MAVIAGLLFLALVYFAVGQAAVLRGGAQTAADAAALGAASDARDQLLTSWMAVIDDPAQWQQFVRGEGYESERACQKAVVFASLNGAELNPEDCVPLEFGFTVTVHTEGTVGESIVPGTGERRATATASAVLEPLCLFVPPEPSPDASTEPPAEPDPSGSPSEEPEEQEPDPVLSLTCGDEEWEVDPDDPVLPGVDDLFRVRLTSDHE